MNPENELKIWDPFVRSFHWLLVAAFAVCYITQGDPRWVHVNCGSFITVLVVLRIFWGIAGSRYARFNDFVRSPKEVFGYLKDVAQFRPRRYLGHDPAGGAMIVLLLVCLSFTVLSGMMLHGVKDKAGPFAALGPHITLSIPSFAGTVQADTEKGEKEDTDTGGWLQDWHEFFAGLTLTLAIIHVCGVLIVSLETRENLIRSMITGRKKPVETGNRY